MHVFFSAQLGNLSPWVMQKKQKTSIGEAELEKYWLVRKLEKLSKSQWILFFIVFLAAVWILNVTLEHFGITPPFEELDRGPSVWW